MIPRVFVIAFNRLLCLLQGYHRPQRVMPGGFRCLDCEKPGDDFAAMGFEGGAYVNPVRKLYERKHGTVTRTSQWAPSARGW